MDGERDWEKVLAPFHVEVVFAYYDEPFEEISAQPSYVIRESNHPGLPTGSHVCAEQLKDAGQAFPRTPSYQAWVRAGKKVVRS